MHLVELCVTKYTFVFLEFVVVFRSVLIVNTSPRSPLLSMVHLIGTEYLPGQLQRFHLLPQSSHSDNCRHSRRAMFSQSIQDLWLALDSICQTLDRRGGAPAERTRPPGC